ncbi:MAG: RagB/SusD family nutrient uptake outer membrane protein [Bacteroidota bacterium]|nr:RagB/SusD family nutrient uptake outer membrane protein [Bacteroidota bacterium]
MGCKKSFLNITPQHYTTEGNFYQTQDDFIQATNAVYGDMQNFILSAHFLEEGRSDNTTYDNQLDQGSIGGGRQWGFMDQFIESSDASVISDAWTIIYQSIKDCNVPLSYLQNPGTINSSNIDPAIALRLQGELRFFRAYFHFIAVQYWGDVPLELEPIATAEQAFALKRNPIADVYKAIIADAQFADSVLPANYTGSNIGRITSGSAKMLLANVYMTQHDYTNAKNELNAIVSSNQYHLLPNYADIFNPANKNNAESIFEVQFQDGTAGEASNFIYQFAPVGTRGTVFVGPGSGGGANLPTLDMVNAYETNDLRKNVSVGSVIRGGNTVYYVKKYDHDSDPNFATTPDDWPVYRYADVLLLLAEAINEQGYQTGEPFDLLNQIRSRAGLDSLTQSDLPDQDTFRKALAHERRVELAFENHRWFDLLRTGTAISVMTAYGQIEIAHPTTPPSSYLPYNSNSFVINQNKLLYPIPSNELNIDPNIKQNPGY